MVAISTEKSDAERDRKDPKSVIALASDGCRSQSRLRKPQDLIDAAIPQSAKR